MARGVRNVFEGFYWDEPSEEFALQTPERHYARLCRSAAVLQIPIDFISLWTGVTTDSFQRSDLRGLFPGRIRRSVISADRGK